MNEGAEGGVLLRWASHGGEGPDGSRPVVNRFHPQNRKIMSQAVIAEMVAERAFGKSPLRLDRAGNDEIGFGRHRQAARQRDHRQSMAAQKSGEGEFRQTFRQRHHRRHRQAWRPPDEDIHPEGNPALQSLGMVHPECPGESGNESRPPVGGITAA